jgi:hypothetical protein
MGILPCPRYDFIVGMSGGAHIFVERPRESTLDGGRRETGEADSPL